MNRVNLNLNWSNQSMLQVHFNINIQSSAVNQRSYFIFFQNFNSPPSSPIHDSCVHWPFAKDKNTFVQKFPYYYKILKNEQEHNFIFLNISSFCNFTNIFMALKRNKRIFKNEKILTKNKKGKKGLKSNYIKT